ncbi:hypothetical protein [Microbacterium sp.]|uniref:hypothetical protein n=1 Tax=Microbacterium sp. TaxID=51671 RepID=UPI00262019E8|nr:hypothetical protein [Microbacterium sp.]MCV0335998.1 hypothetical protein [Microbacterium sp.]MCV0377173.1 hypothetical protein [Microbacterium sp.]MCV0390846.1 hypothetical protein [Microbacterium sp.]MCV0419603.1 hypothetical protein [Microbacterium sp.]MCV0422686.1 hypothetical protein [Microbacterium sp.]
MFDSKARRSMVVMPAVVALFALSACTAPSGDDKAKNGANDAAAARFVSCLTDEGQTAKIVEGGQVGLLMPDAPGDGAMGTLSDSTASAGAGEEMAMTMIFTDDDGTWMASTAASGYPEDGGQRAAWEACEGEVPEFTQPEPDISMKAGAETQMISPEELTEAGLAFASCARDNGFTDFADPDSDGMLTLPTGITEDEARTLLEACAEKAGDMPPMFTQESIEAVDFDWFALMSEYFEGAFTAATVMPSGGEE